MMSFTKLAVTAIALLLAAIATAGVFALATDRPPQNTDPDAKAPAVPAPAAPVPTPSSKVGELQKERLEIRRELAAITEKAYRTGTASLTQFLQAKQAVLNAELELCETEKDRVIVLEKSVAQAKDQEKLSLEAVRSGSAPASSGLEAKLARVEAEIALERVKNKLAAPPN